MTNQWYFTITLLKASATIHILMRLSEQDTVIKRLINMIQLTDEIEISSQFLMELSEVFLTIDILSLIVS